MNAVAEMPAPIIFTDSAAEKVAQLIEEEGNPDLKLRVFVQGGGCSGFQYGFTFDEIVNEDDTTMVKNGVQLLIDSMSYQYLVGAEIDYKDDLEGAQFVIKNPAPPPPAAAVRRSRYKFRTCPPKAACGLPFYSPVAIHTRFHRWPSMSSKPWSYMKPWSSGGCGMRAPAAAALAIRWSTSSRLAAQGNDDFIGFLRLGEWLVDEGAEEIFGHQHAQKCPP
jgi:iron-sulfur cluster insertion protein